MSISRNTAYNMAGHVFSLLVMLVSVPLYLDLIGAERYGVLTVIWLLLGYFGFFDFGIGRAVAHRIAESEGKYVPKSQEILWTGLLGTLPLVAGGVLTLYLVSGIVLSDWIKIDDLLREELDGLRFWVCLALGPLILTGIFKGALVGVQRFLRINVMAAAEKTMLQVFPLGVAIIFGPDLEGLVLAVFLARLFGLFGWLIACQQVLPFLTEPVWKPAVIGGLWRYGGWVTVSALVGPILASVERLIIGSIAGVAAITYYTIPYSIVAPMTLLAGGLGAALFPLFASYSVGDGARLEKRAAMFVVSIITPVSVLMAFLAHPFIDIWIGAEFAAETLTVPQLLILGFWANSIAIVAHARLQGSGRPKVIAIIHVAEIVPYLLLLYILVKAFGIPGAAAAWSLRVIADALLMCAKSRLLNELGADLVFPFVLLLVSGLLVFVVEDQWPRAIAGLTGFLVALGWSWRYGLDAKTRNTFLSMIKRKHAR